MKMSSIGARLYRRALWLYPANHRQLFAEEMLAVFCELEADCAGKSKIAQARFCFRETTGVLHSALHEHWRAMGGDQIWRGLTTARFTMHTEFRFPKITAILMTLSLALVVVAIQRGESISASLPHSNPPIGPIHAVHSSLVPGAFLLVMMFYAAGLIVWAILFALHRSGVHRLDETAGK